MKRIPELDAHFSRVNPSMTRLAKLMLSFAFVLHLSACAVGFVVSKEDENGSTHMVSLLKDGDEPEDFLAEWLSWRSGQKYARVVVWCIAAFMGDVGMFGSPTTPTQVIFVVVFIVSGLLFISIVTGSAASLLANMDASKQVQKDKMDGIKMYLAFRKVPRAVVDRVLEYFEYLFDSGKHYEETGNGGLPIVFDSLPDGLHVQLCLSLKLELVTLCPLFKAVDMQKAENKRGILFMFEKLAPSVGTPNEVVGEQGHFADRLYFLTRGVVRMLLSHSKSESINEDAYGTVMKAKAEQENKRLTKSTRHLLAKKIQAAGSTLHEAAGFDHTKNSGGVKGASEVGHMK